MLIRSQDNTKITDSIKFSICKKSDGTYGIYAPITCECFGEYSTRKKAIKVLDMIEAHYNEPIYSNHESKEETAHYLRSSFQMPADDEVEDD